MWKVTELSRLGTPIGGRFAYPADKRRTKQTTEAMQKAERNLNEFWAAVDEHFTDRGGRMEEILSLVSTGWPLQRTQDWVEPIREATKSVKQLPKIPENHSPIKEDGPVDALNIRSEILAAQASPKTKTRGNTISAPSPEPPRQLPEPEQPDEEHPTFAVSKRTLKTFSAFFHNPSEPNQPGEISWTDFLFAMAEINFEIEKLGGSKWQFRPTKLESIRGIVFHEPHPQHKVPRLYARRHGRRLDRVYGLNLESFVLRREAEAKESADE